MNAEAIIDFLLAAARRIREIDRQKRVVNIVSGYAAVVASNHENS